MRLTFCVKVKTQCPPVAKLSYYIKTHTLGAQRSNEAICVLEYTVLYVVYIPKHAGKQVHFERQQLIQQEEVNLKKI